jgi:hypothetical protein
MTIQIGRHCNRHKDVRASGWPGFEAFEALGPASEGLGFKESQVRP